MNRRGFIELLAALPMLGWLKPETKKPEGYHPGVLTYTAASGGYFVMHNCTFKDCVLELPTGETVKIADGTYSV